MEQTMVIEREEKEAKLLRAEEAVYNGKLKAIELLINHSDAYYTWLHSLVHEEKDIRYKEIDQKLEELISICKNEVEYIGDKDFYDALTSHQFYEVLEETDTDYLIKDNQGTEKEFPKEKFRKRGE